MSFFFTDQAQTQKNPSTLLKLAKQNACLVCPMRRRNIYSPQMKVTGSETPIIYILGESPGEIEDKQGEQFVGQSGQILREELSSIFGRDYKKITRFNNTIRCRPENNKTPEELEIECCRESVEDDIAKSKPLVVIGTGGIPLKWMLNTNPIGIWRGRKIPCKIKDHTFWFFPILHPSFILRNRKRNYKNEWDKVFELDIRNVKKFVENHTTPIVETDYEKGIVTTTSFEVIKKELDRFKTKEYIAIDIETNSLSPHNGGRILSVAIGTYDDVIAFPISYRNIYTNEQQQEILNLLKDFLLTSKIKVSHSLKFELEWFITFFGKDIFYKTKWADTMAQAYVLDERSSKQKNGILSLNALCKLNFGFYLKELSGVDRKNLEEEELSKLLLYNGMDSKYTFLLYIKQKAKLTRKLTNVYNQLVDTAATLAITQANGVLISREEILRLQGILQKQIEDLDISFDGLDEVKKYNKLYGKFNPLSTTSVSKMFSSVLHLNLEKKTDYEDKSESFDSEDIDETFSTDKTVLAPFAAQGVKVAELILKYRPVCKLKSTYVDGIEKLIDKNCILRTSFNHLFTRTGRTCIAKGTRIETVRDLSKSPLGILIENIKEGDLVYSFDENKKVVLKKVKWIGKTGNKKVLRIHWLSSGRLSRGFLDLTPEHLVRILNGDYVEACKLKIGDQVLAIHRSNPKTAPAHLYATGNTLPFLEHRFICEQLNKITLTTKEHVHHKDHNPLNNLSDNLQVLSEKQHLSYHGKLRSELLKENCRLSLIKRKKEGKIKKGIDCKNYINLTKFQCLRIIVQTKASIINSKYDFFVISDRCKKNGLDYNTIKLRYCGKRKEYIPKSKLILLLNLNDNNFTKVCGILKCDYYKFKKLLKHYKINFTFKYKGCNLKTKFSFLKELCKVKGILTKVNYDVGSFRTNLKFYNIDYKKVKERYDTFGKFIYSPCVNNHLITGIEYLEESVDVYDLEVEDTHNCIANELCIHNSSDSPNLQNIPHKTGSFVRSIFVARKGYKLVAFDYGQLEARVIAMASKDEVSCNAIRTGYDVHREWTLRIKKMCSNYAKDFTYEQLENDKALLKPFRDSVKNKFVFPLFFGSSFYSIARDLDIPETYARELTEDFWDVFKGVLKWQDSVLDFYEKYGYVETLTGRRRRAPLSKNKIVNSPIQGTASDLVIDAMNRLAKLSFDTEDETFHPILNIHDDLTFMLREDNIEQQIKDISKEMCRKSFDFINVPLGIECSVGDNWDEMKKYKEFSTVDFLY